MDMDMTSSETILEGVRRQLATHIGRLNDVARDSGVPYHTLIKIHQGQVENPRIETIQKLLDYFAKAPNAAAA